MTYTVWTGNYVDNYDSVVRKLKHRSGGLLASAEFLLEFSSVYKGMKSRLKRDLTLIAQDAVKSTIPIFKKQGGTLRNQHVESSVTNTRSKIGSVWVDDRIHRPPYNFNDFYTSSGGKGIRKDRPTAASLAELLNTNREFRRTRASETEPGYKALPKGFPTSNWVGEAKIQADRHIEQYLNTDYNYYEYSGVLGFNAERARAQQRGAQRSYLAVLGALGLNDKRLAGQLLAVGTFQGKKSSSSINTTIPTEFEIFSGFRVGQKKVYNEEGKYASTFKGIIEQSPAVQQKYARVQKELRTELRSGKRPDSLRDIVERTYGPRKSYSIGTGSEQESLYDYYKRTLRD